MRISAVRKGVLSAYSKSYILLLHGHTYSIVRHYNGAPKMLRNDRMNFNLLILMEYLL